MLVVAKSAWLTTERVHEALKGGINELRTLPSAQQCSRKGQHAANVPSPTTSLAQSMKTVVVIVSSMAQTTDLR